MAGIAGRGMESAEGDIRDPRDPRDQESIHEAVVRRNTHLGEEEGEVGCTGLAEGPEVGSNLVLGEGHHRAAAGKEDSPVEVGGRMEDSRVLEANG